MYEESYKNQLNGNKGRRMGTYMTDVPEPEATGSTGTQRSGSTDMIPSVNMGTFDSLPITRAVEGLAATRSRGMGGEVVAGLLAGSFGQISHELAETKADLRVARAEITSTRDALSREQITNASLRQCVLSNESNRLIHNIAIFVGTILLGSSIEFYKSSYHVWAFVSGLLGVVLVLVGWLNPKKEVRS